MSSTISNEISMTEALSDKLNVGYNLGVQIFSYLRPLWCITNLNYDLYLLGHRQTLLCQQCTEICIQLDDGASNGISFVMRCWSDAMLLFTGRYENLDTSSHQREFFIS